MNPSWANENQKKRQAEIDRLMSEDLETSTELSSAKGIIVRLEEQVQSIQYAYNEMRENPDETSYRSRLGADRQAEGSVHNSDDTTLPKRGAGGTDYASGPFAAEGIPELDPTITRTLGAQNVPAAHLTTDVSHFKIGDEIPRLKKEAEKLEFEA